MEGFEIVEMVKRAIKNVEQKQKQKFGVEKYRQLYLIEDKQGGRLVQYKVWRTERPHVYGYGMTKNDAIYDLIHEVQPL